MPVKNSDQIDNPVVLFDGVCNLCNSSVRWIIKHDKKSQFRFASLQSDAGLSLLKQHKIPTDTLYSIIFLDGNRLYEKSDAIIRINCKIGFFWSLCRIYLIVPKRIRNAVYNFIAKNRYKWFGRRESCMIPTEDIKSRFI